MNDELDMQNKSGNLPSSQITYTLLVFLSISVYKLIIHKQNTRV